MQNIQCGCIIKKKVNEKVIRQMQAERNAPASVHRKSTESALVMRLVLLSLGSANCALGWSP